MATVDYTLEDAAADIADLRSAVTLLEEAHEQIDGGFQPNTPTDVNSHVLYSNQGTPSWVNDNALQMGMMGAQISWFPLNTVTGATFGNLASWNIPAGDAIVNAVYEIDVWGSGTTGAATATGPTFAVFLGGNEMSNVPFGTSWFGAQAGGQSFRWRVVGRVINHTIGASGTWSSYIHADLSENGNNLLGNNGTQMTGCAFSCEIASTTTVDTTVTQALGISAEWSTTTGAPTMTSRVAIAKRIC